MYAIRSYYEFITSLSLSKYALIVIVGLFYILLGLFLDGISITVMSLPITLPLVLNAGFDPIWFGIFLVIMIELGLITPPIGFNLFVVQGVSKYPIEKTARITSYNVCYTKLLRFLRAGSRPS